ncbi:ABC transporter ATP-binding protein [Chloroflexi bacterium TSY]|nr:ABC transporter ATP-binding protein [Chloroflexi bacterium TSY]
MLKLRNIHKTYDGSVPVLHDIELTVATGEIVCLLGPSGCGKTTLLRIVAGLEKPDRGELRLEGDDLTRVPVHRRNFGLMFQEFALFPHKSVGENVAFGLRMAGQSRRAIAQRVHEMLRLVSLEGYEDRSIFELSGGERQRVALARSLAPQPRLLMLDEPLGSLDRTLREELMTELSVILKQVGVTALYVTHDQEEAYAVADRVVVMNRGMIAQIGTPAGVYHQPASEFVARFLGFNNLLPATVSGRAQQVVNTPIGDFPLTTTARQGNYTLLIRPDAATIAPVETDNGSILSGTLTALSFRGGYYRVQAVVKGADSPYQLDFTLADSILPQLTIGQKIKFKIDPNCLTLLGSVDI